MPNPGGPPSNRWFANFDGTLTCIVKVKNAMTRVKYNNVESAFGVKGSIDMALTSIVPTVSFELSQNEVWANSTKHKYTAGTDLSTAIAVKAGDEITGKCEALFIGANGQIAQAMKSVRDKVKADFEYRFSLPESVRCVCAGYTTEFAICARNSGDWSICAGRTTDPGPALNDRRVIGSYWLRLTYDIPVTPEILGACRGLATNATTKQSIKDICIKNQFHGADGVGNVCQTDVTGWPKACMLGLLCEDKDIQNHECYLKVK